MYVPKELRKTDNALQVATNYHKHCGIDSTHILTCWGKYGGRKYKEQFEGAVTQVSVGDEYFC